MTKKASPERTDPLPGTTSQLRGVDHRETYGRHLLESLVRRLDVSSCLDLGCGGGDDLLTVRAVHPGCRCVGIDFGNWNRNRLESLGIEFLTSNIESSALAVANESFDLVIANQVFEHTKEIYWINHEIFRALRVGGCLFLGVPNVLAFHNRILGLAGHHPTCAKMISAHMRVFSKRDTILFYNEIVGACARVEGFYGSQFYPLPRALSRPLSRLFPSLAGSIFFVVRKTAHYNGEFVDWLSRARLETNYFAGDEAERFRGSTHAAS